MKKDSDDSKKTKKSIKFFLELPDNHIGERSILRIPMLLAVVKIYNIFSRLVSLWRCYNHTAAILIFSLLISTIFCSSSFADPISAKVKQVALSTNGGAHACAVTEDGDLYCWGKNSYGQIGNGSTTDVNYPVKVITGGVASVSLGLQHTCALKETGELFCWGCTHKGAVGNGAIYPTLKQTTPVQVLSDVSYVTANDQTTCAINNAGILFCWGDNMYGQAANGTTENSALPVPSLDHVRTVTLGGSTISHYGCAITDGNQLYCWGRNDAGQLGDGTRTDRVNPVTAFPLSNIESVSLGGAHTCAVTTTNQLYCWGSNGAGQVGNASTEPFEITPVLVESSISTVVLGRAHSCALTTSNGLKCWGDNSNYQVGNGDTVDQTTPHQLYASGIKSLSVGMDHTYVQTSANDLYCFGLNQDGQLGLEDKTNRNHPVNLMGYISMKSLVLSDYRSCGVTSYGELYCWGRNMNGEIGNGETTTYDTPVTAPTMIFNGISPCAESPMYSLLGNTCSTALLGICDAGIYTCIGSSVTCQPQNVPTEEICNDGLDNDCNGYEDNYDPACSPCLSDPKYEEIGSACEVGEYACTNSGTYYCDTTSGDVKCNVAPLPPTAEICDDGIDNDCDSKTDNDDEDCPVVVACSTDPKFSDITNDCDNGKTGNCRRTGHYYCNTESDKVECDADKAIGCEPCSGDINFTNIDKICDNGKNGTCKTTGTYVCNEETDIVICTAPKNESCAEPQPTPTLEPTPEPEEVNFAPYDSNNENPPSVIQGEEPLPVYVKIEGKKAKVYFQWFRDFLNLMEKFKALTVTKAKKPNNKPKKNYSTGASIEEEHCQQFPNRNAFNAAQRNCEKLKKTGVRINQVTKCKKVKVCTSKGFSKSLAASRKPVYALKKVRRQIITGTKMQKLKKQGKEPNVITVKLKKNSTYSYRYQVVQANAEGKIKKKLTPYSKPFRFSTK